MLGLISHLKVDLSRGAAPVIRGNPWGLDKGVVNDDWPYVIFDWDNHFGAYMLSLDAKELGYSALIQVVKAKTGEGFVPNTASSVDKARHSQPPVGSKILLEMFTKYLLRHHNKHGNADRQNCHD